MYITYDADNEMTFTDFDQELITGVEYNFTVNISDEDNITQYGFEIQNGSGDYNNGTIRSVAAGVSSIIAYANVSNATSVTYKWWGKDTLGFTTYSDVQSFNIPTNISVNFMNIYPVNPSNNSVLTCEWNVSHAENQMVNSTVQWYNGAVLQDYLTASFMSNNATLQTSIGNGSAGPVFTTGETWQCKITASSGNEAASSSGSANIGGFVTPSIQLSHPQTNGQVNNTPLIIDMSCPAGDKYYLWFGNSTENLQLVLANSSSNTYDTDDFGLVNGTYNFYAGCLDPALNRVHNTTGLYYWTFDNDYPRLSLVDGNGFNDAGFSLVNQYGSRLPLNMSVTENRDLFAFLVNITLDDVEYFSYQNESLSGLAFNYSAVVDTDGWPAGTYKVKTYVADSHTNERICPYGDDCYKAKDVADGVKFDTPEGNSIIITSKDPAEFDVEQKTDRYSILIDFDDNSEKKRYLDIYADKPLIYQGEKSGELAHFVVFNREQFAGNWIDFNADGLTEADVKVKEITPTHYEIEFKKLKDKVKFKSIGGLNVFQRNYTWYRGVVDIIAPYALDQQTSQVYLNVSYDVNTQRRITAFFNYSGNVSTTQTLSNFSSYLLFTQTFTAPENTRGSANETDFNWTITVVQSDLNTTTFVNASNHTLYGWDMDDCSTYTTPLLNYSTYNEKTGVILNSFNGSFVNTFWLTDGDSSVTRNYDVNKLNGQQYYNFCKFPAFVNFTGDTNHIITKAGYEGRDYRLFGIDLSGAKKIYLLATEFTSAYITYRVTDQNLATIEGAVMSFFRSIGGVSTLVHQATTDFAGSVTVYQDQQNTYDITINASGFPFKQIALRPTSTFYTIQLVESAGTQVQVPYSGVRYRITPKYYLWNITGDPHTFTLEVEGSNLEYFGAEFSRYANMTCWPSSCKNESTNPSGGTVTIQFNTSVPQRFLIDLYYKVQGQNEVQINSNPAMVDQYTKARNVLYDAFKDIYDNTSPATMAIIVAVIEVSLILFLASFRIYGYAAIPGLIALNWWLTFVGLRFSAQGVPYREFYVLHPSVATIMTVLLAAMFFTLIRVRGE